MPPLHYFSEVLKMSLLGGQPHPGDDEGSVRARIWA